MAALELQLLFGTASLCASGGRNMAQLIHPDS